MKNLTPELIEKAKTAKTAEELQALAKENGIEMPIEEANASFAQLNPTSGELSDDELDNVAGGACGKNNYALKDGDRVKVRPDVAEYCYTCKGTTGIFHTSGDRFTVTCDNPNCSHYGGTFIHGFNDGVHTPPEAWVCKI